MPIEARHQAVALRVPQRDYYDFLLLSGQTKLDSAAIFRLGLDAAWRSHFGCSRAESRSQAILRQRKEVMLEMMPYQLELPVNDGGESNAPH